MTLGDVSGRGRGLSGRGRGLGGASRTKRGGGERRGALADLAAPLIGSGFTAVYPLQRCPTTNSKSRPLPRTWL